MKHLVIDIEKHYPPLKNILNADYYCPEVPADELVPLQPIPLNSQVEEIYGFPALELDDLQEEYDVVSIVWPIQSFDDSNDRPFTPERRRFFEERIFPLIESKKAKEVWWFDDCDRAIVGKGHRWLLDNGYPCDHVFKREYRRTHVWDYQDNVYPFPFMTFGKPNPPWMLYERRVKGNAGATGCFWSGAPINRFQAGVADEWCNRLGVLREIHQYLIMKSGLPKEEFLNQFNTYKCFLHLNGTGHLCGRFFEGLSRDSLMIMQEMDTVFPFQDEMFFAEECIFEMPHEFIEKFKRLMTDDDLYERCKKQQDQVLEKYFNYDYIRSYICSKVGYENL